MAAEPDFLVVGHVTKAHGIRGELLIRPLTDRPEEVFEPGRSLVIGDEDGKPGEVPETRRIESSGPYKRGWKAGLEGVTDRTAAELLAGRYLLVPRAERGELEAGEYYYHQLLGLEVRTADGEVIGRVREVYETEPRHLLEVKGEGRMHLIPFGPEVVVRVELEAGRIVIDPPEGLLEL